MTIAYRMDGQFCPRKWMLPQVSYYVHMYKSIMHITTYLISNLELLILTKGMEQNVRLHHFFLNTYFLWHNWPSRQYHNTLAHSLLFCSSLHGCFFGGCCSLGSQWNGTVLGSLILAESFTKRRLAEVELVSQILDGKVPRNASMPPCAPHMRAALRLQRAVRRAAPRRHAMQKQKQRSWLSRWRLSGSHWLEGP